MIPSIKIQKSKVLQYNADWDSGTPDSIGVSRSPVKSREVLESVVSPLELDRWIVCLSIFVRRLSWNPYDVRKQSTSLNDVRD